MTRLLSASSPVLVFVGALALAAAVLGVETGRRRLKSWMVARARRKRLAAQLAGDSRMASRADQRRDSFVRRAEEQAVRNAAAADLELERAWPTASDLAAAADEYVTDALPVVEVPSPRTRPYVLSQLPKVATP